MDSSGCLFVTRDDSNSFVSSVSCRRPEGCCVLDGLICCCFCLFVCGVGIVVFVTVVFVIVVVVIVV